MSNLNRPFEWIVVGSGVSGPMVLTTSGQRLDRQAVATSWTLQWNTDGSAGSGWPSQPMGLVQPKILAAPPAPLIGGSPTGTVTIEGSNDGIMYVDLGVTVSSLFASSSGIRLINIAGPVPEYQRLTYRNASSSGVFNVGFKSHGYGG